MGFSELILCLWRRFPDCSSSWKRLCQTRVMLLMTLLALLPQYQVEESTSSTPCKAAVLLHSLVLVLYQMVMLPDRKKGVVL